MTFAGLLLNALLQAPFGGGSGGASAPAHLAYTVQEQSLAYPSGPPKEVHGGLDVDLAGGRLHLADPGLPLPEAEWRPLLDARALMAGWLGAAAPVLGGALQLDLPPQPPDRLRRIRHRDGRLQVWFSADGEPLRARLDQHYQGRIQRIAPTEELRIEAEYTFGRIAGCLVVTRLDEVRTSSVGYHTERCRWTWSLQPRS